MLGIFFHHFFFKKKLMGCISRIKNSIEDFLCTHKNSLRRKFDKNRIYREMKSDKNAELFAKYFKVDVWPGAR